MENRHGLAVGGSVSQATGTAERETALDLIDRRPCRGWRITFGADKGYDVTQFVYELRDRSVTPHIAIDGHLSKTGKPRKTAVDGRTGQGQAQRSRAGRRRLHAGARGLQPDPPAQAAGGADMNVRGNWRVVETPGYNMAGPGSYILFAENGGDGLPRR